MCLFDRAKHTRSVHPHARGEHIAVRPDASPVAGSSPRAWGTWQRSSHSRAPGRFIPTRVGNIPSAMPAATATTVHPHARGEHTSSIPLIYQRFLSNQEFTEIARHKTHQVSYYQIVKERPSLPQPEERKQVLRHRVLPASACWFLASQNRTLPRCSCAKP